MNSVTTQKTDRRILKTRSAIINAYYQLLCENTSSKITIAAISRLANIDRKTFYLHFTTVDDVLKAFCSERIKELTGWMDQNDFYNDPLKLLNGIFVKLNEILYRDADFYRHLAGSETFQFFWDRVHEILVDALVNYYADQVKPDKQTFCIYCNFFISGIVHLYKDYLNNPQDIRMENIGAVVQDILEHGAGNLF